MLRRSIQIWFVVFIAIIIGIGILMVLLTPTVNAQVPGEATQPLNCLSCHQKVLKGHDKLGEGSKACWACHSSVQMGVFHLASGQTQLPRSDYPVLCAQCHQKRYEAWVGGTHGVPAWKEGSSEVRSTEKVKCASCHDPHQPQVVLSGITLPHPPPSHSTPPLPRDLLIMLGVSLLLITAAGVAIALQGKRL